MAKRTVVLIGGGHAHIEVLRQRQRWCPPDVELWLLDVNPHAVYSGSLPAVVAGHWPVDQCLINLPTLCEELGVRWCQGRFLGLSADRSAICLADGRQLKFDLASLDIGSVPSSSDIANSHHGITAKPALNFLQRWQQVAAEPLALEPRAAVVVGGSVAGVELILAMRYRLHQLWGDRLRDWRWHLCSSGPLLSGHNRWVRARARRELNRAGVEYHDAAKVRQLGPASVILESGREIPSGFTLLCTPAAPPQSLGASRLPRDPAGFVPVDQYLRVTGFQNLFAVGDIAAFPRPLDKAGVYAVRQGPLLAANLGATLSGAGQAAFRPQRQYLKLITLGEPRAMASRGWLYAHGHWVWRWKQHIDEKFVERYRV